MSEEEKKAIEVMKSIEFDIYEWWYDGKRIDIKIDSDIANKSLQIILNLIEKQNKKIEELKVYDNIEYQKYLYGNIEENYIPKSVIRKKIESLKEQLKNAKDEAYDICESKIWALEDLLD